MAYRRIYLLIDPGWGFARSVLRGVRGYLRQFEACVVTQESPLISSVEQIRNWRPDGIIGQVTQPSQAERLAELGVPVVNVSAVLEDSPFPRVRPDDHACGRMGAAHLLERGFRHFAFGGLPDAFSKRREAGFSQALQEAGFSHSRIDWVHNTPELPGWLARLPKPVAVMTANDIAAGRVLEACLEADLRVPDDVSVLGIDNDDLICEVSYRTVSSVPIPFAEVGFKAAGLLLGLMRGESAPSRDTLVAPLPVVTRESTDLIAFDQLARGAPEVADALRHIRTNLHRRLTVASVADAVGSSRRSLERHFKERIGRSVLQEILRARVERARTLIIGGEQSMKGIARQCGFSSPKHFSTAFRHVTGQAPTAFADSVRPLYAG